MKKIPVNIKIVMSLKVRKLTAVKVAHLLAVTKAAVSYWCTGAEVPSIALSLNLIHIFNSTQIIKKIPYAKRYVLTMDDIIAEKVQRKLIHLEEQLLACSPPQKPPKNTSKHFTTKARKNKRKNN